MTDTDIADLITGWLFVFAAVALLALPDSLYLIGRWLERHNAMSRITNVWLILTNLWSVAVATLITLAAWRPERHYQGLVTKADADQFVEDMHGASSLTPRDEPEMPAPIFDELVKTSPEVWADFWPEAVRALRTPTMEVRIVFADLTKDLDLKEAQTVGAL